MAETTVLILDGDEDIVVPEDDAVFVVFDALADAYSQYPSTALYPGVDIYPGTS